MSPHCYQPNCCGSDGEDCCIPECEWSSWHDLLLRLERWLRKRGKKVVA